MMTLVAIHRDFLAAVPNHADSAVYVAVGFLLVACLAVLSIGRK